MSTVLRSISAGTGALVGALTGATIPIAAFYIEGVIGHPTSTAALGLLLTIPFGAVGAAAGGLAGWAIARIARTRGVSPERHWPTVGAAATIGVLAGFGIAYWLVWASLNT